MYWETVLWPAVALLSPALVNLVWPGMRSRLMEGQPAVGAAHDPSRSANTVLAQPGVLVLYLRSFAPWLHGIAPAYLALITGAVYGRDFGIAGRALEQWLGGALVCALWIALTARFVHPAGDWPKPTRGALDEPRWALYRAAGSAWIGSQPWGALIGLGMALGEVGLRTVTRSGNGSAPWEWVARAASSSVLFVLTGSFWLTLVTQGVTLYALRGRRV